MQDPTRDEMLQALAESDFDETDREEAIYWFANDYHGGQGSELYIALCMSPFSPSRIARGPCKSARFLYEELEATFA